LAGGASEVVLAFDVNETLLDLRALDDVFERVFADRALRPAWFQQMLQLSFVGGLTGQYVDFTTAQRGALLMLAGRMRRALTEQEVEEIVGGMRRVPPYPEAAEALSELREAGFRQVTLTNSPLDVVRDQLAFAGLSDRVAFFDFFHHQTGVAPNEIELHPILAFRCLSA
jgi:2-haloacid dehalogenase